MSHPQSDALPVALLDPAAYPWRPPEVELIETHMSWVYLAGDRVVKVRRPVAYSFVDHTSLAARERSARDEVRVNRRLSDGVYLGVEPVTREGDRLRLGGAGEVVDWATVMRRLPDATMLDRLIAEQALPPDTVQRLADRLVPFHLETAARCETAAFGTAASLLAVLTDNLDDLEPFSGNLLGATEFALVSESVRHGVLELESLTEERRGAGWVRDGHGDLRAEHVNLETSGQTQVFDAVEFSAALRCADVASDIAYLLVDLRRRDADALAAALLAAVRSGGVPLPNRLLRLYMAHRALVKAKTICLASRSRTATEPELDDARSALDAAHWVAVGIAPALVVMTGLSGTGKSTVAARLARGLGYRVCSSDVVRRRLFATADTAERYRADATAVTYEAILGEADAELRAGQGAILDATFQDTAWRDAAARLAADHGAPCLLVETLADVETTLERLRARSLQGTSLSEADATVYLEQRRRAESSPPPVAPGMVRVPVHTDRPLPDPLNPVFSALADTGVLTPSIPSLEPFASA